MLKVTPFQKTLGTMSLLVIAFWWLFFIAWQPGFIHVVQLLAFRLSPTSMNRETVTAATQRAYEYAAKGLGVGSDLFFGTAETSHLADVYQIYLPLRIFLSLLAIFGFGWLIYLLQTFHHIPKSIFRGARNLTLILVGFGIICAVFFSQFFILFHQLLFPQGNWSFPESSLLIQIFPEEFWQLMLIWFVAGALLFAAVFHFSSRRSVE